MLVTFLVFASLALVLLVVVLWFLWPSSRISTSVPGLNPSVETLGNVQDIRDAGGLAKFLNSLHRDHGSIASFWINDFLTISLNSSSLFSLVSAGREKPYQSLVPLTTDQSVLETVTRPDQLLASLLSSFSPFSSRATADLQRPVERLVEELFDALKQLREEDHISIEDYVTALVVKIVSETSPDIVSKPQDPSKLRSLFASLSAELDLFLDFGAPDLDADQKSSLSRNISEFCEKESEGGLEVFSQILVMTSLTSWALYYLAMDQELQTSLSQATEAKLEMFLTEVVRVSSLVPVRARVARQDLSLLGHTVEQGTLVIDSLSSFFWSEKNFPNPREIDINRPDCQRQPVLSLLHSNAANSYSFQVVLIVVRKFVQTFKLSPACCDMIVDQKFRLVMRPDCDIWLKLDKK